MQPIKYRDLNTCVRIYKNTTGCKKDEAFIAICKHLTHHINSFLIILLDRDYNVNMAVFKMIKRGLQVSMGSAMNDDTFNITIKMLAQGFSDDDITQQIYLCIIDLMQSYTHEKLSFLEFVTYLLPRRIFSWLQKNSKDAASQFSTEFYSGITEDSCSQDSDTDYPRHDPFTELSEDIDALEFIFDDNGFLSLQEKDFMIDYLSTIPADVLCKKYYIRDKALLHSRADAITIKLAHALKHQQKMEGAKLGKYREGTTKWNRNIRCKASAASSCFKIRRQVYANGSINRNFRR